MQTSEEGGCVRRQELPPPLLLGFNTGPVCRSQHHLLHTAAERILIMEAWRRGIRGSAAAASHADAEPKCPCLAKGCSSGDACSSHNTCRLLQGSSRQSSSFLRRAQSGLTDDCRSFHWVLHRDNNNMCITCIAASFYRSPKNPPAAPLMMKSCLFSFFSDLHELLRCPQEMKPADGSTPKVGRAGQPLLDLRTRPRSPPTPIKAAPDILWWISLEKGPMEGRMGDHLSCSVPGMSK